MRYEKKSVIVFRVSGITSPISLKTIIVVNLKLKKKVILDLIGVAPNYIATKAIIMTRGFLLPSE